MAQDPISSRIQGWARRGDAAVLELMPLHAPLRELPGEHRHKRAIMLLSTSCLRATESVLYLVEGMRLWDAELVMRSVVEGTAKFGYLLESPAMFTARCIEYRDALPSIAKLKWHAKAGEALNALAGTSLAGCRPYRELHFAEEELDAIRSAYPRETRNELERRWGFTALVEAVSKPGGAFGPTARALLHGYSVASHLQHMSYEGTDMPMERDTRPERRREAIELAHAAKLIGHCFHLTSLRVIAILRFLKRRPDALGEVHARHESLIVELKRANEEWEEMEYPIVGPEAPAA
jgi:hypothetical protein